MDVRVWVFSEKARVMNQSARAPTKNRTFATPREVADSGPSSRDVPVVAKQSAARSTRNRECTTQRYLRHGDLLKSGNKLVLVVAAPFGYQVLASGRDVNKTGKVCRELPLQRSPRLDKESGAEKQALPSGRLIFHLDRLASESLTQGFFEARK